MHLKLEGKYSLESTDPRESEIRAHLRLFTLEKIPGLQRFWTVTSTPG